MGQVTNTTTPYVPAGGTPVADTGTVMRTPSGVEITAADIDEAMATLSRLRSMDASAPLSAPDQAAREELQSLFQNLSQVPPEQLSTDAQEFMYALSRYEGNLSIVTGEPLPDMFLVQDLNSEVLTSLFDEVNKSPDKSYDEAIALYLQLEDELQQSERLLKQSKHQQRMTAIEAQKNKGLESGMADAASMRSAAIAGMAAGATQSVMAGGALHAAAKEVSSLSQIQLVESSNTLNPVGADGKRALTAQGQALMNTHTTTMKDFKATSDHRSMQGQSWSAIGQNAGQMAGATSKTEAAIAQSEEKEESATATAREYESGQSAEFSQKAGERRDRVLQSFADAERARGEMLQKAADVA